jgi:hypothetical protein
MAMGLGGSLDDAFKNAASNMAQWLIEDYKLTPSELAEVIGPAAEYRVSEVADAMQVSCLESARSCCRPYTERLLASPAAKIDRVPFGRA